MNLKIITGSVDVHINDKNSGGKLIENKILKYLNDNNIDNIKTIFPVQVQWEDTTAAYYTLYYTMTIILNE